MTRVSFGKSRVRESRMLGSVRAKPYGLATRPLPGTKGLILLDQARTVDKVRLAKWPGAVSSKTLAVTLVTLQDVFAA